jgi:hypothetical protein
MTVAFLHAECPPHPAGADTYRAPVAKAAPIVINQQQVAQEPADENLTPEQLSERTLKRKVEMLNKGIAFLKTTPDYVAQFTKRELVNGELLDEQTMTMKMRHEPLSVYLKWLDYEVGREVMYVDGVNDGKMLVHPGGWRRRLPAMLMPPDSSLAMAEARYPVTRAGMLALAMTVVGYNSEDLKVANFSSCKQLEDQQVGDRTCTCFVLEYKDRSVSAEYRKSITLIDKEWCVPLYIKNFGWPSEQQLASADLDMDEATLLEHYTYTDVKFRSDLSQRDFDHTNEDYGFVRQ